VVLHGLVRPLRSGSTVRLRLVFAKEGPVNMEVPVVARAAQYATLAPPVVAASPAATGAAGHPGVTATPSPSAS
jgi:copper(I)-binding protein